VRTIVLVPYLRGGEGVGDGAAPQRRTLAARVEETAGLARAIDLDVVEAFAVPMASMRPPTLLGSGKVAEIAEKAAADAVGVVVIDHPLSPVQQRNLERAWNTKVIDRTGLILEIFGERAQTREGRLQVELAHLTYQKSRLVRSWTHLERQRGGFGFLGGPGETQIEADRRHIQERIGRIERELAGVVRTRRLQRSNRRRVPAPVVALVGYTNAGKTTLFNALTRSDQRAENLLFATLDPTLRRTTLPHGTEVVISDTVGFISDLPTHLVAAFRATLEEVVEADLILHVRDASHPDREAQAADVNAVLTQLGIDPEEAGHIIEVWNKIDVARDFAAPPSRGQSVSVSALTGEGIDALLQTIEDALHAQRPVFRVHLEGAQLAQLHQLYEFGEVLERDEKGDGSTDIRVRLADKALSDFLETFPNATSEARMRDVA
jgi:GTP-binding protein HflX